MTHTPGPWVVDGSFIYAPDGGMLAQVINMGSKAKHYPLTENRDLMAAGPELLAVLEDFDNWFCGFNPDDQASRMEGRQILIRARAASAKARGKF